MKSLVVFFMLVFATVAFAQAPSPSIAPSVAPAIVNAANQASDALELHKSVILLVLGFISEAVMRAWPTKKPLSWFSMLASILIAIGMLAAKVGSVLNNVVDAENAKQPPQA